MKAQSRRQRRREEREMRAQIRFLTKRWHGCARLYEMANAEIQRLQAALEDERRAKYAEVLVHADANVPRGVVRLMTRIA